MTIVKEMIYPCKYKNSGYLYVISSFTKRVTDNINASILIFNETLL
ncbi:hypothetical protein [Clostridium sp. YIM B02506]|nr:hypothetical protein [Clostridium sp. YIM B02506]